MGLKPYRELKNCFGAAYLLMCKMSECNQKHIVCNAHETETNSSRKI